MPPATYTHMPYSVQVIPQEYRLAPPPPSYTSWQSFAAPVAKQLETLSTPSWQRPPEVRVHRLLATAGCRYLRLPPHRPTPSHWATVDITACTKLFVGQLRYEVSAEQFAALIEQLTGVVAAGATYQRSGCLVLRFFTEADREAVRALNRKLLCDVDGMWYAETEEAEREIDHHIHEYPVQEFRRFHLPRSTVVVEHFRQD